MRILLLSDFYPPVVGGVEQHVRTLAHALAARGHRVAVATVASGDGLSGSILDGPVAVHRLGSTLARLPGAHAETGRPFTAPAVVARTLADALNAAPGGRSAQGWAPEGSAPEGSAPEVRPSPPVLPTWDHATDRLEAIYRDLAAGPGRVR